MDAATTRRTVGILIFEAVEVLDLCGPFEVLATTRPLAPNGRPDERLFDVVTIAETREIVRCVGGLLVQPHHTIHDHPPLDIVVVPGGRGTRRELSNPAVFDWVAAQAGSVELMTSVCTGAFLLAECRLLDGKRATTHWASIDWLRDTYPAIAVLDDQRVVDEDQIVTSAGVSAGIDMALHIVTRLHGRTVANQTARNMEYGNGAARKQLLASSEHFA